MTDIPEPDQGGDIQSDAQPGGSGRYLPVFNKPKLRSIS